MRATLEKLLALEQLEADPAGDTKARRMRTEVPAEVLRRFDHLRQRGRLPVARVANDICGGCYLQLPRGVLAALHRDDETLLCQHCGRFLYLARPAAG